MRATWALAVALEFALVIVFGGRAHASDLERVEVRVTFSSGDSVYLDRGRNAGFEQGDIVELEDPERGRLSAELVVVSSTTARAVMRDGEVPPAAGTRGEVLIPADRKTADENDPEGAKDVPDHPPWERVEGERDPEQPLLSPPYYTPRAERDSSWRGRIWTHLLTSASYEGRTSRYFLGRIGTDLTGTNIFGAGGILRARFDVEQRTIDVSGGRDDSRIDLGIDRLSYTWGGAIDSPFQVQLGRFVPRDTPELGLVDGIEATVDVGFGRIGLNVGAFPEPLPDRRSLDDVGATLSWRFAAGELEELSGVVAVQQTWHEGNRDRSLIFSRLSYTPTRDVSIFGSAWIDHYDSGDDIKNAGLELTEAHLSASWRFHPDHRVRVGASRLRWPEIERNEFASLPAALIKRNQVTRFDVSTSHELADSLRLDTRVGHWSDRDDDGLTGHVTLAFPNVVADRTTISVTGFRTEGASSQGNGLRVSARHDVSSVYLSLAYELTDREFRRATFGDESSLQHAIVATADFSLGRDWSVSVNGDYRFGEGQDALSLGVFLQWRF